MLTIYNKYISFYSAVNKRDFKGTSCLYEQWCSHIMEEFSSESLSILELLSLLANEPISWLTAV